MPSLRPKADCCWHGASWKTAGHCAALRSELMGESGSHVLRANKNRCLRVAGVEIYLDKLLRSTVVNVVWDPTDLMVLSMEGELVAKFDYPFPQGVKYLSLKHAMAKFQNMPDPV